MRGCRAAAVTRSASTFHAAAASEAALNYITFQSDFGPEQDNYWDGVDVTLNARTRWG